MSLLDELKSQTYESDPTKAAVWVPGGGGPDSAIFDGLLIFALPDLPYEDRKDDGTVERGVQTKLRLVLNFGTKGFKPNKGEWVVYEPNEECNIFVPPGQKLRAVVKGMEAGQLEELLPGTRIRMWQEGQNPPRDPAGHPTKLYVCQTWGPNTEEAMSCPAYQYAIARGLEEAEKMAKRNAAIAARAARSAGTAGALPVSPGAIAPQVPPSPPSVPSTPAAPTVPAAPAAAPAAAPVPPTAVAPAAAPAAPAAPAAVAPAAPAAPVPPVPDAAPQGSLTDAMGISA